MNADLTMGELLARFPGAGLTLFSRFGIGSRDKLGFRPQEPLRQVLARYLVFDTDKVLDTIQETHDRQSRWRVPWCRVPGSALWIDCRAREEFEMASLPGARYLDGDLARRLREERPEAVLFCRRGDMSAAAAEHFRSAGLEAWFLEGGLESGAPDLPVYGGDATDQPGRLRILPFRRRARILWEEELAPGEALVASGGGMKLWRQRGFLVIERDTHRDWPAAQRVALEGARCATWRPVRIPDMGGELQRLLDQEVNPSLQSHKGHVRLVGLTDEIARLELSGGCQGCSSAAITVSEEIASTLMEQLPFLLEVKDATDHEAGGEIKPQY